MSYQRSHTTFSLFAHGLVLYVGLCGQIIRASEYNSEDTPRYHVIKPLSLISYLRRLQGLLKYISG